MQGWGNSTFTALMMSIKRCIIYNLNIFILFFFLVFYILINQKRDVLLEIGCERECNVSVLQKEIVEFIE